MAPEQYTRGERLVLWITGHLPRWLLEQPERVVINVACFLIGVSAMIPPVPASALAHWPTTGRYVWGVAMMVGACFSILGAAKGNRTADRAGALLLGSASLFFAFALFGSVGLRGVLTGIIFLGLFFAKALRFLRSTAVRIRIRHHLLEMKELQDREAP
jgi:O-antigen ligase